MLPLSNYNGSLKMLQWIRPPPAGLGGQWMSGRSTGVLCRKSLASVLHSAWHCHLLEWCLMGFFNKTQNIGSESLIYASHQGQWLACITTLYSYPPLKTYCYCHKEKKGIRGLECSWELPVLGTYIRIWRSRIEHICTKSKFSKYFLFFIF